MAKSQWRVQVDNGLPIMVPAGKIHVALNRAFVDHPLPPMGQVLIIKVTRVGTLAPVKRRR